MPPTETGRLRTLIVDDERLARQNLRDLLEAHNEILIVGEARNADEAEVIIIDKNPDLIFLDIQMPGCSGFDLLERLDSPPPVIFVTAFDHYAIRAFEVNALDYLLKPVEPERLARAIDRLQKREAGFRTAVGRLQCTDRVCLDAGRKVAFLQVAEIAAIKADGNYTHVFSACGRGYLVRVPLSNWEARLPDDTFVVLDRSLLINRSHVRRCVLHDRRAELYLGSTAQPFLLGRVGIRRFKKKVLSEGTAADPA